ncbi:MAG: type II secretion system protein [Acidobacteria bacterium]|nr:type II secretion system protein [Acidobacteriota bacterium]
MKNHKGYSFLELVIVLTIVGLGLIIIGVNIGRATIAAKTENVLIDMAIAVSTAQNEARRGATDIGKRTFDLQKADIKPHSGVVVTSLPPLDLKSRCSSCPNAEAVLCVSEQSFCHSTKPTFTFNKFSGELTQAYAIFVLSQNRNLVLLITQKGELSIAELINGQWRSRTDLQNLLPRQQKTPLIDKG